LKATANPLKKSALSILDEGEHVRSEKYAVYAWELH